MELFELISVVIQILSENIGLVSNFNPKKDIKLQKEILDYIFDFDKPKLVSVKCY